MQTSPHFTEQLYWGPLASCHLTPTPSTDSQGEEECHTAGTPKYTKTKLVVLDLVEVKGEKEVRRERTHASMEKSSPSRGEAGKSVSNNFIPDPLNDVATPAGIPIGQLVLGRASVFPQLRPLLAAPSHLAHCVHFQSRPIRLVAHLMTAY